MLTRFFFIQDFLAFASNLLPAPLSRRIRVPHFPAIKNISSCYSVEQPPSLAVLIRRAFSAAARMPLVYIRSDVSAAAETHSQNYTRMYSFDDATTQIPAYFQKVLDTRVIDGTILTAHSSQRELYLDEIFHLLFISITIFSHRQEQGGDIQSAFFNTRTRQTAKYRPHSQDSAINFAPHNYTLHITNYYKGVLL